MANWNDLPPEIRVMIQEIIGSHENLRPKNGYASVCKEWQPFYEKQNFQRLELSPSCLDTFDRIVRQHRRELVKHICLNIELVSNPFRGHHNERIYTREHAQNNEVFSHALWRLFCILEKWKEIGKLVLEFDFYELRSIPSYDRMDRVVRVSYALEVVVLSPVSVDIPWLQFQNKTLPEVKVVHTLLLSRRSYRALNIPSLGRILEKTVNVQHVIYETSDTSSSWNRDCLYRYLIRFLTPTTVKTISLLGLRNKQFPTNYGGSIAIGSRNLEQLSIAFLIEADVFFRDFFPDTGPETPGFSYEHWRQEPREHGYPGTPGQEYEHWKSIPHDDSNTKIRDILLKETAREQNGLYKPQWPNLTKLALTSSYLHPHTPIWMFNYLLQAAAKAAKNMPKLEIMELWNHDKGIEFVFRYQRGTKHEPRVRITMIRSWNRELDPQVFDAWRDVAYEHTGLEPAYDVRTSTAAFDNEDPYGNLGLNITRSVFDNLELRELILHFVRREDRMEKLMNFRDLNFL